MRFCHIASLAASCLVLSTTSLAAPPRSNAIDRGPLDARQATTPISLTIALRLPNLADAEKFNESLYTPGSPQYHQFLSTDEFVQRFAPTPADVAKVISALAKYNLKAEKTTATTLKVNALPADIERAFSVSLHSYEMPPHGKADGYTYIAPTSRAIIPAEMAQQVSAVIGLNTGPAAQPMFKAPAPNLPQTPSTAASSGYDPLGQWTVLDFAKYYDVDPLYQQGLTGAGRTLGILTFAGFTPSDVFKYWKTLGLKVNPNRITVVGVDGCPCAPSDASGSVETTLDVEQAGGIAPGANIIVYEGPSFFTSLADVFAAAIDANKADTLGLSWGVWEWLLNEENYPVPDPITGQTVGVSQAVHELMLRASIQGQTVFAAAGDGGAYEANDDFGCYGPYSPSVPDSCSLTLSVIGPADDPNITASGGTTLPGVQQYCLNAECTPPSYDVDVPHERVWGWDYLEGLCAALGTPNPVACGIFPTGGGGGVSVMYSLPSYQFGVFGTQLSFPGQAFSLQPYGLLFTLPSFYPGRNLPDISFNADPQTGYLVYYTSNETGFGISTYGGTSFTDQQLNGVLALIEQQTGKRLGALNPTLYGLLQNGFGYLGPNAPFHPIAYGDNWFYYGSESYNLGAGIGTLDVANFAQALHSEF
jgi:kumamolisin